MDSHFLDHSYLIACGKYQNSEAQSYSGTLDIIVNLCNIAVCEDKMYDTFSHQNKVSKNKQRNSHSISKS